MENNKQTTKSLYENLLQAHKFSIFEIIIMHLT